MSKKKQSRSNQKEQSKPKSKEQFTLYDLLEVKNDASTQQIKKQYKKLVFKYHPDKNKDNQNARQQFHKLKEAYDILMDKEKRQEYDQTGSVGGDFNEASFQTAYQYFRTLFKKITEQDIISFEKEYRFGPMEEQDLTKFYLVQEGDMTKLLESIPLSLNSDVPRFIKFFQEQISEKELPILPKFKKTKNKVRQLVDQTEEFEEMQKKKKQQEDMNSLVLAIRNKNGKKDFIAGLQEKYGMGKKKKIQKPPQTKKPKKQK